MERLAIMGEGSEGAIVQTIKRAGDGNHPLALLAWQRTCLHFGLPQSTRPPW